MDGSSYSNKLSLREQVLAFCCVWYYLNHTFDIFAKHRLISPTDLHITVLRMCC